MVGHTTNSDGKGRLTGVRTAMTSTNYIITFYQYNSRGLVTETVTFINVDALDCAILLYDWY